MPELAICGHLVDGYGVYGSGCINIEGDRIASVTSEPRAPERLDYRDMGGIVLPGMIDLHVHLRGLKLSYKEDEATSTRAAAASGITLVADMPNTMPPLRSKSAIDAKLAALRRMSLVDYAVYAGVPDEPEEARGLAELPIAGFKVYPEDLEERRGTLRRIARLHKLLILHAEHPVALKSIVEAEDTRAAMRGCWAELAGLMEVLDLGPARLHVTHASCPSTVLAAKKVGATVDATPHHLFYSLRGSDCGWRVNPPLRSKAERLSMLKLLAEGMVDALASDHAPHLLRERIDPLSCSPGFAWLDSWPLLAACLVASGTLSLQDYARLTSLNPARILGIDSVYGSLQPGMRANIVVIKLERWHRPARIYSKGENPIENIIEVCAALKAVIVGGTLVYLDGEFTGEKPETVNAIEYASTYLASSSPP
ncbi:dihydroorotase [Hyperthermus butylicus]|uniref:Dihydroorotase n=1 Tax=Hyperthermus butylicus (strain DSM 5456 / JCM 9403 / PLM1-5) TaxID=415426 RepID=A2BJ21_HYPBU|nr:dihydroorotase [Hyperthermus butylicus]ABM79982.1 Dihydroorotase [Hyperthermus butylicus DSM 5456]